MTTQSFQQTLISAQGDGSQLSNSVSATSILPAAAKFTLPANTMQIGTVFRVTAMGRVSNVVTTPGTLTLDVRLGAVIAFNGGAMQMSTTAHTNVPWYFQALLTVRAIGASTSANMMGQAVFASQAASVSGADSTTSHGILMAPNTAPAVGTGFDSTASQVWDLFATFSVNTNPTNLTLHQYILEQLN